MKDRHVKVMNEGYVKNCVAQYRALPKKVSSAQLNHAANVISKVLQEFNQGPRLLSTGKQLPGLATTLGPRLRLFAAVACALPPDDITADVVHDVWTAAASLADSQRSRDAMVPWDELRDDLKAHREPYTHAIKAASAAVRGQG